MPESQKGATIIDIRNKIQIIRDLIDKVIVKKDGIYRKLEILGRMLLMPLKLKYEPISRNRWSAQCWKKHVV